MNEYIQAPQNFIIHSQNPKREMELFFCDILDISRETFFLEKNNIQLNASQQKKLESHIQKSNQHIPCAYILGKQEFYGLTFEVNKHTLIPRPETEILVDIVIRFIQKNDIQSVYDIGTGSGCIAIAIASKLPKTNIIASDISQEALNVAQRNMRAFAFAKHVSFIHSDLLSSYLPNEKSHIIVANLPYVETTYTLPKNVEHEPKSALFSGEDGLNHYRDLLTQAQTRKNLKAIFLEIAPFQVPLLTNICKTLFPQWQIRVSKDQYNKDRFFILENLS